MNHQNKTIKDISSFSLLISSKIIRASSFTFIAATLIVSGFFVASAPAYAAHTATVTVNPTLVKGGQTSVYSFGITNDSGSANFIYIIKVTAPTGFTINGSLTCPVGWTSSNTTSIATCTGDPDPDVNLGIAAGANTTISFSATAPGTNSTDPWAVLTKDNVFASQTNNQVTTVDATAPTVTSIMTKDTNSDGSVETATITFSEAVNDSTFAANNFTIGGSPATAINTGTADDNIFDIVVSGGVAGTGVKQVNYIQGTGADLAGNLLGNVVDGTVTETDAAAPVATSAQTKTTTTIDITFSEDLNGSSDSPADFTVEGNVITATSELNGVVTLTLGNPIATNATPLVTVHGNGVDSGLKDLNNNWTTEHSVVPTDGIVPTFTAETLTTTTVQVTFSENVDGGTAASAWTVGGTPATAASDPGGTNSLTLTVLAMGTGDTPVVVYVAANGDIADTAANEVANDTSDIAEDGVDPTVTITSTATSPTKTSPIPMTATFSEVVSGFILDDITVGNGGKSNFATSDNKTYTFDVTPTADGLVTVAIAGAIATDAVGNNNTAAINFSITYDSTPPTLAIVFADPALKAGDTSLVTFTFSEAVIGFNNADITTIDNGTLSTVSSADSITWTATFTPTADIMDETNVITVDKSGVADAAGNAGVGMESSATYTIDTLRPTVTAVLTDSDLIAGETTTVTFIFSEAPTGFNEADVAVENGSISVVIATGDPLVFTATLTPTADIEDATNILTVATSWTDPAGNAPAGETNSLNYTVETKKPSVVLASATANPTNGLIAVTAEFTEIVTEFDVTDITVVNGAVENFVAVDGDSYTFNVNPDDGESIAVTIDILADKALDVAENNNTVSNQLAYTSDTVAPTVLSIIPSLTTIAEVNVGTDQFTITVVYSEAMDQTLAPQIPLDPALEISGTLQGNDPASGWSDVNTYVRHYNVLDINETVIGVDIDITTAKDLAGNTQTSSNSIGVFNVDTSVPSAPTTPDLTVATDSNINTDNITNDATPDFTTTAEIDSMIVVYDGALSVGTMTATGGADTITISTLSDGVHSITVKTTDAAGNISSASDVLSVTIDTSVPNAVFSAATDDVAPVIGTLISGQTTDDIALVLSGTNESGSTVEVFDGVVSLGQAIITDTAWSYEATMADGATYQFNVKETDIAGNISSATGNFTVIGDTSAPSIPTITSIAGSDNKINNAEKAAIIIEGTAEPSALVSVTLTNGANSVTNTQQLTGGAIAFSITLNGTTATPAALADGTITPLVTATDAAGNVSSAATTPTATQDTVAPNTPSTPDLATDSGSSSTDNITNDNTPTFTGTAEADATVKIYDGVTEVGSGTATLGNYSITVSAFTDGVHSITAVATDVAGNVSSASSALSVTIDTGTPGAVLSAATDNIGSVTGALVSGATTDDTSLTLSGTNESGSTIEVFNGAGLLGQAIISGTAWSYEATVADGTTYQFNVKETDVAGNTSSATGNFTVIGDTSAPSAPLAPDMTAATDSGSSSTDNITNDNTPTFTGTAEADATVKIYDGVTEVGSGTATLGNYSITVSAFTDGVHSITAVATDVAGNVSSASSALSVTIDTGTPAVPVITSIATDNFINNAEKAAIHVIGAAEADSTINVSLTNGVTVVGNGTAAGGNFDITIDGTILTDGTITPSVTATDVAGNVSAADADPAATKDVGAPSVTGKTPGANAVGIAPSTSITITSSEYVVVEDADVTITPGNPVKTIAFDSDTNVATINPDGNLNDNTTYTITLDGVMDMSGNLLPTTSWSFTTAASYSIDLTTGWNLISLPVVPTDTTASAVLGALDDTAIVQSVFTYNALTGEWLVYHPDSPETSDFSTMNTGNGYWVDYLATPTGVISGTGNLFLEGASTPPQKELVAGWNLIGYYQLENTTEVAADAALSTVDGQWTQLRTYDNMLKQFQSVTGVDTMSPGQGYWIFMKSSTIGTYIYGPGDAI